jgi:hypothetical protein
MLALQDEAKEHFLACERAAHTPTKQRKAPAEEGRREEGRKMKEDEGR